MSANDVTGRIFDIQRFSIHDGPGIRTIVFFKGCRLRCRWCCNPESQEYAIQTMRMDDGSEKVIGRDVTVREVMEVVERDRPYYRRSGGGMTLSGGEVLCQPAFAEALLSECHAHGLNTAIESTACAPYEDILRILPHLDLYMMDIKHMDSRKHQAFTGQPNALMLENAAKLARDAKELIIRVPVVPGFNDTPEEIGAIARFTAELGVRQIHLLPYHRLGQDKYRWLARDYTLTDVTPPTTDKTEALRAVARSFGLDCS